MEGRRRLRLRAANLGTMELGTPARRRQRTWGHRGTAAPFVVVRGRAALRAGGGGRRTAAEAASAALLSPPRVTNHARNPEYRTARQPLAFTRGGDKFGVAAGAAALAGPRSEGPSKAPASSRRGPDKDRNPDADAGPPGAASALGGTHSLQSQRFTAVLMGTVLGDDGAGVAGLATVSSG